MTDRMLSAALGYAEQFSWAVLPLRVRGKAPAIPRCRGGRGYLDATTDLETIERLWREYPDANVGVSCIGSGFVALDVDPRHRGDRTLAEIERRYGPLPHTVRQLTGGGGEHILFGAPRDLQPRGSIGPGIDVKWRGFIVAAPSVHPHTHRPYAWMPDYHPLRTAIAVSPEWLLELLFPSNQPRTTGQSRPPISEDDAGWGPKPRYSRAALLRACERVAHAPVGQQDVTLVREAFSIGSLVGAGLMPAAFARNALIWAARSMANAPGRRPWTAHEVRTKVARGLAAGERHPRHVSNV